MKVTSLPTASGNLASGSVSASASPFYTDTDASPQHLREILDYDPNTGKFLWKKRCHGFINEGSMRWWNDTYAGKEAFATKNAEGYFFGCVWGKRYRAARVAWAVYFGTWPKGQIDHINGVHSDNRIKNLRDVSPSTNMKNRSLQCNSTSGVAGVRWHDRDCRWIAEINEGGKRCHLGSFKKKEDAITARKTAEKRLGYYPNNRRGS